ncbi:MAG: hypothetical protein AABO41_08480 [Acidobacteriota bacterium]
MKSGAGERVMSASVQNGTEQPLNWEQRLSIMLAKRPWIVIVTCLALATAALLPILIFGFPRGSDATLHYRWSAFFTEALREGVVYPRWLAGANHGHGSPVMNCYSPLPLYVTAAFNLLLHNTLQAMTLSCGLAFALSGMTMYVFSRSVLSRGVSLFAAGFYVLAAYHFFDLYPGSAINEFWSFVWLPLVLDATYRIAKGEGWRASAYLGLSYALLILTHVLIPFATALILPIYILALTRNWRRLAQVAGGLALGLGLSAFFLISVVFERQYVKIALALDEDYRRHFLFRRTGPIWNVSLFSPSQVPYNGNYLLEATLVAGTLAILFLVGSFLLWRERGVESRDPSGLAWRRAIWVVTALTLFMTTRRSAFIWRAIPPLAYLQFPNRWLVISTAGTSLIAAAALAAIMQAKRRRILYGTAFAIAVAFNLVISAHQVVQAPYDAAGIERKLHGREVQMYMPVWRDENYKHELVAAPAEILSGDGDVQAADDRGSRQSYVVTARTSSTLGFRQLYFPGWVARVDGNPIALGPNRAGSIQLTVEPGEHHLTLSFEDTWPRTAGKLISAVCIAGLFVLLFVARRTDPQSG